MEGQAPGNERPILVARKGSSPLVCTKFCVSVMVAQEVRDTAGGVGNQMPGCGSIPQRI